MDTEKKLPNVTAADTESLAFLFHKATKFIIRAHHHEGHAEHAQMRILAILQRQGTVNQRDLLETLNVRSTSLSELMAKMEQRNLISRTRDVQDKRNFIVTLTEQGVAAIVKPQSARQQHMDALFADFSESEREQLAALLSKFITSLEKHVSEHHPHRVHHSHEHGHHHPCGRGRHGRRGRDGAGRRGLKERIFGEGRDHEEG